MSPREQEIVIMHLISELRKRSVWTGAPFIQTCSYLLEKTYEPVHNFKHYWFRRGPFSSVVSDILAKLRSQEMIAFGPEICTSGPAYVCTEKGTDWVSSCPSVDPRLVLIVERFCAQPENQRLLLGRAMFMLLKFADDASQRLSELGIAGIDEIASTLSSAKELLRGQCRPAVAA